MELAGLGPETHLLEIKDLAVAYRTDSTAFPALRGVSLALRQGETLGVVGETGSGKTTLAHSLLGLLPPDSVAGTIFFQGQPLSVGDEAAMRGVRWRKIALVFQTASTGFNPVYRVRDQVAEPLVAHAGRSRAEALAHVSRLWQQVGLPLERLDHYPHQLSGGEKRLAMLAMGLACDPQLLVLDEPTAGLDSITRRHILALLRRLKRERQIGILLITHTLGDLEDLADRALVLYAGRVVEVGQAGAVLAAPRHPYTWGLVNAYPTMARAKDLWGIRGEPPNPAQLPPGCAFAPRCTQAVAACEEAVPPLVGQNGRLVACFLGGLQTLLEVRALSKTFAGSDGRRLRVVRQASLSLQEGEVLALVGQTGSGKSTLAKMIVGLLEPDEGEVLLEGSALASSGHAARRRIQIVGQDPADALSPRLPVVELVREPLDILEGHSSLAEREERSRRALADVRLPTTPEFLAKRTHELSGGQLQRVAIARALVLRPKVLIADEPVSMLDPSEQARVIRLLKDLQNEQGMGLLLISHDLALVRKVADRIVVLSEGVVVEEGPAETVIASPRSLHARRLLDSTSASIGSDHGITTNTVK